jgi:alkanesulfonate monooxygenase SsuD/methylene tetrahydromethanopterin reductase-like flavin-dependent oxidoreductase (luciferase family)
VLLGGEGPHTLQRVVDFCEGWFPRARNLDLVFTALGDLRRRAAEAGRDMKTISVSLFGLARPDAAVLDRLTAAGLTRVILRLPSEGRDTILPLLDEYARLVR